MLLESFTINWKLANPINPGVGLNIKNPVIGLTITVPPTGVPTIWKRYGGIPPDTKFERFPETGVLKHEQNNPSVAIGAPVAV